MWKKKDSAGNPVSVATVTMAGIKWNVDHGSNGANKVFSFLTENGKSLQTFSGDIVVFLKYLTSSQGLASSQYLVSAGAGTEATSGSNCKFTVSGYSLVIT